MTSVIAERELRFERAGRLLGLGLASVVSLLDLSVVLVELP